MEAVLLADGVLDELQGFDVRGGDVVALEMQRALLEAANGVVARDGGGLGVADGFDGGLAFCAGYA